MHLRAISLEYVQQSNCYNVFEITNSELHPLCIGTNQLNSVDEKWLIAVAIIWCDIWRGDACVYSLWS